MFPIDKTQLLCPILLSMFLLIVLFRLTGLFSRSHQNCPTLPIGWTEELRWDLGIRPGPKARSPGILPTGDNCLALLTLAIMHP